MINVELLPIEKGHEYNIARMIKAIKKTGSLL